MKILDTKDTELLLRHVLEQLKGMLSFLDVCNTTGYRFLDSDLEDLNTR